MDIRPIHTDEDHAAALAEIESLWGVRRNSEGSDRLDLLATLVEAYEEQRWPIPNPNPIIEAIGRATEAQGDR